MRVWSASMRGEVMVPSCFGFLASAAEWPETRRVGLAEQQCLCNQLSVRQTMCEAAEMYGRIASTAVIVAEMRRRRKVASAAW